MFGIHTIVIRFVCEPNFLVRPLESGPSFLRRKVCVRIHWCVRRNSERSRFRRFSCVLLCASVDRHTETF